MLALLVGACSGAASSATDDQQPSAASSPQPAATAVPPDGFSASLVQYRRDQPRRFVEVKLDNSTGGEMDVTLLGVTLPGFVPPDDVRRTVFMQRDRRIDLPVPLGDVICDRPPDDTANATVEIVANDRTVRTSVPVDDDGLLDRLHTFECGVQLADTAVAIELSPSWQPQGSGETLTVSGEATITAQQPDLPVEITSIDGGILFVIKAAGVDPRPPIAVDAQRSETTVTFEMIPARCDGHAIAEARRLTTVSFAVAVDGAEAVPLRRSPDEAGYQTLVSALRERCGSG